MAKASITFTNDAMKKYQQRLVSKSRMDAALVRSITKVYIQAQVNRWQTQNASEGSPWAELDSRYVTQKRKRFAAYPESGSHVLIATSNLLRAATLESPGPKPTKYPVVSGARLVSESFVQFMIRGSYPRFVASKRPIMKFSAKTKKEIVSEMGKWVFGK